MGRITKEQWKDAVSTYVLVMVWQPKPTYKKQVPIVHVAGDYPTYSKAMSAKKKIEKKSDLDLYYNTDRRTVFVARKFDVEKLDLFDTYIIEEEKETDGRRMVLGE